MATQPPGARARVRFGPSATASERLTPVSPYRTGAPGAPAPRPLGPAPSLSSVQRASPGSPRGRVVTYAVLPRTAVLSARPNSSTSSTSSP